MSELEHPTEGTALQDGQMVVVPPHGPGRIIRREQQPGGIDLLVIAFPAGHELRMAAAEAADDLRLPADQATAESACGILRQPDVRPDGRPFEERFSERMAIVAEGDLVREAGLLRSLYASPTHASPGERTFRDKLEQQVLLEIAEVLGLSTEGLRMEMHHRYLNQPASADQTAAPAPTSTPPPAPEPAMGQAAVDAAPPAVACHLHPRQPASDSCARCLKPICEICALADKTRFLCPACTRRHRRTRRILQVTAALLVVALLGGVAFYFALIYEAPFDYGRYAGQVHRLSKRLEADPCDRVKMLKLAELMLEAGDLAGTVERSRTFFSACEPFPRLRWVTYEANKRRGEYDQALADVDQLIDQFPYDKDFRWWRGEVYERKRHWDLALADYRQALALQPKLQSVPFDLARVAPHSTAPCEAIFALEQFVYHHPDYQDDPTLLLRLERLYRDEACAGMAGRGEAGIPRGDIQGDPLIELRLTDGHSGRFLLDMDAAYCFLARTKADRLGLPAGVAFISFDGQQVREGQLVQLDRMAVGQASAERVAVVVLPDKLIPAGADGVLGLTFLTRFALSFDPEDGTLLLADKLAPQVDPRPDGREPARAAP